MSTADNLLAARDVLIEHGWQRGNKIGSFTDPNKFCVEEALAQALTGDHIYQRVEVRDSVEYALLLEVLGWQGYLFTWNDTVCSGPDAAIGVFDSAARLAKDRGL